MVEKGKQKKMLKRIRFVLRDYFFPEAIFVFNFRWVEKVLTSAKLV